MDDFIEILARVQLLAGPAAKEAATDLGKEVFRYTYSYGGTYEAVMSERARFMKAARADLGVSGPAV